MVTPDVQERGDDEPMSELDWLAELREAASIPPLDLWLLMAVDERVKALNAAAARSGVSQ